MVAGLLDTRFLNSARIQTIIETAASYLERVRPLVYLDRLDLVNATDDELMGRFTGRIIAADIIADGQKALVYESGQIQLFTTQIPNIKIGQNLTQAQLNLLSRLSEGVGRAAEEDAAFDWEMTFGENLLAGVRERMNAMAAAMMIDSYSYDRWGVKLTGATWGMPANLKVTPTALWSLDGGTTANVNATPLADMFALDRVDADNYGLGMFDRATMSSKAFDFMLTTTEFSNKAWMVLGAAFLTSPAALKTGNRKEMLNIAERVLNKTIIIDDKVYREVNNDGTTATTRALPINKVLLDRTGNGRREWDFGNGIVTESMVASMLGGVTLGDNPRMQMGGSYGPVGYYTAQDSQLNPPGVNGWAVARAFPRKSIPECSAVLTVW